ncbi:hypothetical protein I552_0480 [Mycobacterium xenopi 3993]|nr:hypothetical protein I552_0480 [Mycobacterium xenopi 3993]
MRAFSPTKSAYRDTARHDAHCRAGELVFAELRRSRTRFPDRFHSLPEAVSVLEEELDELTDAVRANMIEHARAEAVQVGAMALRLIVDLEPHALSDARDRLAMQAAVSKTVQLGQPAKPLVSAHEGRGLSGAGTSSYVRHWFRRTSSLTSRCARWFWRRTGLLCWRCGSSLKSPLIHTGNWRAGDEH